MSFLARLLGPPPLQAADATDDIWYNVAAVDTAAGVRVSPELAVQVSTVFACVKVISESLGILPCIVYERVSETSRRRAVDDNAYQLLHNTPNGSDTPFEFKELLTRWAALYGMGLALKVYDATRSRVDALVPVHPDRVRVERIGGHELRFQVKQPDGTERPYLQDEVFCLRGPMLDGLTGVNLSKTAREAIALARAAEAFGSRYFANDLTVGVVLEHPGKLSKEAHERLKSSLVADGGWQNAHKAKILEEGMKLTRVLAAAKDAQLLEVRQHQTVEICRFFRVPPHKVQHLAEATFSNIEQQSIEFVTDTVQPWAVRWEQAITRDLILEDDRFYAEFLMTALLRGDSAARATYYRERFYLGTLSPNEIRRLENEDPRDGGDVYYVQGATVPLDPQGIPIQPAGANDAGSTTRRAEPVRPAEPPPPPPVQPPRRRVPARAVFSALLHDAAERLARAETRELEQRADRAIEDHQRFSAWVDEFYGKHLHYVAKTLQPLAESWEALTEQRIDVPVVALRIRDHGRAIALSAAFCQAPKQVIEQKRETVRQLLDDTFHWDD